VRVERTRRQRLAPARAAPIVERVDAPELPLRDAADRLAEQDRRFRREAYLFVVLALAYAVERLPEARLRDPERRHLSGPEVLSAVVALGRDEFGPLASTVFDEWGVRRGEDVGALVFGLVACGQLSARPEDSLDDFRGVPDLLGALAGSPSAVSPETR